MANGDTKTEAMLNVLGNGGSGDEFRGCCNTKTQQYILDAIDRINSIQPGGSYDAGTGINIANNTISVDTNTIQEKLTAGTNITIDADNVISASGGGSITPVQTTGTSTTDVMSQNATTSMVYTDPTDKNKIRIGNSASIVGTGTYEVSIGSFAKSSNNSISIGSNSEAINSSIAIGSANSYQNRASATGAFSAALGVTAIAQGEESTALGSDSSATGAHSVALGDNSKATQKGQVDISTQMYNTTNTLGYNNSSYRLLTGLYDGQSAHDAVTVGQVNAVIDAINTALSTNISHIGA